MVAGADANILFVKDLADVMGVEVTECEAEHASSFLNVSGAMNDDV